MSNLKELGKFTCESGKLVVSDPCYTLDVWCMGVLENVLPGIWRAYADYKDEGSWGVRVAQLVAVHDSLSDMQADALLMEQSEFEVGVDSGQAGIFDYPFYRNDDAFHGKEPKFGFKKDIPGDRWYGFCCDTTLSSNHAGVLEYGTVSNSGYGDGGYTCHVGRNSTGQIVKVVIDYELYAEDEDGYEDE